MLIVAHLQGVVKDGVLEVEPEDAVVRFGVEAVLSHLLLTPLNQLIILEERKSEHLEEAVPVLGSELDSEVQVLPGPF